MAIELLASTCSSCKEACPICCELDKVFRADLERLSGGQVSKFKIGSQETSWFLASARDRNLGLARLIAMAEARGCKVNIPRGPRRLCVEFGDHVCTGQPGCGCGCC